jgi:hypothetical protein
VPDTIIFNELKPYLIIYSIIKKRNAHVINERSFSIKVKSEEVHRVKL